MNLYFIIYFICCTFYFTAGVVSIVNNRKEPINKLFFVICMNLSSWSLYLGLMSLSTDVADAVFYRRIMVLSWSTLYAEIFFFILLLTKSQQFYNRTWKIVLIILPAVICFYMYFFSPVTEVDFVRIKNGWAFLNSSGRSLFWNQFFNLYYVSYMFLAMLLLYRWIKNSEYEREIRQGTIIFRAFVYIFISGTVTDVLLPMLGVGLMPPVVVILSTVAIGGMSYAIIVYKMMNITPENIMLDVYKYMNEGIMIADGGNRIMSLNQGGELILGYKTEELKGMVASDLFFINQVQVSEDYEENFSSRELKFRRRDNKIITILMSGFLHTDQFDHKVGTVYTFQDMSELKQTQMALEEARNTLEDKIDQRTRALKETNDLLYQEIETRIEKEAQIHKLAFNDQLTGLPNRRYFYVHLENTIKNSREYHRSSAVLFMDLDGFKMINDTLGHDKGDQLLILVSKRVRHILREEDLICRVGGDEFLILLEDIHGTESVEKICEKIIHCLQSPFKLGNNKVHVKSSIGIACYPDDGLVSDDLVKHADISMYKAKDLGKNQFVFFNSIMKKGIDETMYLSNDLYRAFEQGELKLYYQPQVDTMSHKITGFEALLRWQHPTRGLISPVKFIPLAERTGLIIPIGEWVIKTAAMQQKRWKENYGINVTMGINLSMRQLKNDALVSVIAKVIAETGVDPSMLEFEITESLFMDDTKEIIVKLNDMKALGVKISIDDFGTEYSSMSYLKLMPIDRIKIPKPFIDGINIYPKDDAIISSLIVLAKNLECRVIAEGVETKKQLDFLMTSQCDDIQGFYFHKPMDPKAIEVSIFNKTIKPENEKHDQGEQG